MTRFQLRPATAADATLTYDITRDAMQAYVVQTWGSWDEAEQQAKHREHFTPATHRIVLVDGREAGLLAVEHEPAHLWLVKVYLTAPYRGTGVGSALVRQVVAEADAERKAVRLRVLRVNTRARALYERLGFEVVGEEPDRFFMVRPFAAADGRGR
jgi:ribosomal protein S18 acetylase RimI-like enzyme